MKEGGERLYSCGVFTILQEYIKCSIFSFLRCSLQILGKIDLIWCYCFNEGLAENIQCSTLLLKGQDFVNRDFLSPNGSYILKLDI